MDFGATVGHPGAGVGRSSAAMPTVWSYAVSAGDARVLDVEATFPAGTHARVGTDGPAMRFVRDLRVRSGGAEGAWRAVGAEGGAWAVPECARGCALRYRFALAEAAAKIDDVNVATAYDGAIEAPPSTWLVRPEEPTPGASYRFEVTIARGLDFASGVTPAPGGSAPSNAYEAAVDDLEIAPYSVFGTLRRQKVDAGNARIERVLLPGKLTLDDAAVDRWVALAARAVVGFYGEFPVRRVLLGIAPSRGDGVSGKTLASGGASIMLDVGAEMNETAVPRDWVLVHEMTHLALPSLPQGGAWLEEGLATYVEPIARARVGTIPPEEVWRGLVEGLPQGQPEAGDRGLDRTPTWGRTYWGGALFCLMADVGIRRATQNRKGLDDALRGILRAGGNGEVRWPLARVLAVGDAAVGVTVLTDLHAKMGTEPVVVDLDALWAQLGVRVRGRAVTFDDAAPDAAIRRGITGAEARRRGG